MADQRRLAKKVQDDMKTLMEIKVVTEADVLESEITISNDPGTFETVNNNVAGKSSETISHQLKNYKKAFGRHATFTLVRRKLTRLQRTHNANIDTFVKRRVQAFQCIENVVTLDVGLTG